MNALFGRRSLEWAIASEQVTRLTDIDRPLDTAGLTIGALDPAISNCTSRVRRAS